MSSKLVIEFDNMEAREHFKSWLSEQGEQDYWIWMEAREQEEDGPITAVDFDYALDDNVIYAECGRLDDEE